MVQRSDSTSNSIFDGLKTEYSVVCGNKSGILHTDRLGSGSKGKCIYCESSDVKWFTPKEFEKFGGRETSKDWKRSVKLDGKPFYFFLNNGELKIHAFNCYCQICLGDGGEPGGPIKFFSPPNRKRRAEDELSMPSMVSKGPTSSHINSNNDTEMNQLLSLISQSIDSANTFDNNQNIPDQCDAPSGSQHHSLPPPDLSSPVTPSQPTQSTCDFKQSITLATEQISDKTKHIEDKLSSLGVILNSIKSEVVSLKNLVKNFDGSRQPTQQKSMNGRIPNEFKNAITDTLAQVLNQAEFSKKRQREDSGHCANCNSPAPFKCGRCNRVRYCSEFCQQRDWPVHNKMCGSKCPTIEKDSSLITDNAKMNLSQLKEQVIKQAVNNSQYASEMFGESSTENMDITNGSDADIDPSSPVEDVPIKVEQVDVDDENSNHS